MRYDFQHLIIELVVESPEAPMQIMSGVLTVELSKTGAFHTFPLDENGTNVVMFKMDNSTKATPEISFQMSDDELARLKEISVLPVIG